MNQITFQQYRSIDLTILTVLTVVFEAIATLASNRWFAAQPIAMSITLMLVCMTMMRWSGRAAMIAIAGGITFCVISGATIEQYLIYGIGNLFSLLALVLIKIYGKEKIRTSVPRLLFFVLVAYLGMALGRWGLSLLFGGNLMVLVVYLTTDIMSLLLAEIILLLLRKTDGMIEDQKAYLLRVDRERKEKQEESFQSDEEF